MARSRLLFHEVLKALLPDGQKNVYFQAPPNNQMKYPCYIYKLNDFDTKFANNSLYNDTKRYEVTAIDRIPDSVLPGLLLELPLSSFQRFFVADGLNHFVFNIYF